MSTSTRRRRRLARQGKQSKTRVHLSWDPRKWWVGDFRKVLEVGRLLSSFAWDRTSVGKINEENEVRMQRAGYRLTRWVAYVDRYGRLWLLPPGYVWDGPSYWSKLECLLGRREKEALLLASAMHDAFDDRDGNLVVFLGDEALDSVRALVGKYGAYTPELVDALRQLFKEQSVRCPISISHGATLYRQIKADYPLEHETIGVRKRWRQTLGLLLGQRLMRLFSGRGEWVDLFPTDKYDSSVLSSISHSTL